MTQAEIIKSLTRKISNSIRVSMPATIEHYDFKTQKANVKIDMRELYDDNNSIDYPVLTNVPIIFPRSGNASITMPISRGDSCIVFFLDRDISEWLLGASNKEPNSQRSHSINDAVAIMGLYPFTKSSPAKNNSDLLIQFDGSDITLKPNGIIDITSAKEININTGDVTINCQNANIKATGQINTESPDFIQKGNLKIDGNVEVTGTSHFVGNAKCDATLEGNTVKTSAGINLGTHKHSYNEAQSGSQPTIVTPSVTGRGI